MAPKVFFVLSFWGLSKKENGYMRGFLWIESDYSQLARVIGYTLSFNKAGIYWLCYKQDGLMAFLSPGLGLGGQLAIGY